MSVRPNSLLLPITAASAGALGLAYALSNATILTKRASTNKLYGAEEGSELFYLTRGAGTIGEYAPIGLILLGLMERERVAPVDKIQAWAGLFVAFRIGHGLQLALPQTIPLPIRAVSSWSTVVLLGAASLALLTAAKKNN